MTLDDAVNLMPGVSSGNSGGTCNERLIFVRGFSRFEVPLTIDGIRVYLPADNRLDFGRFLTSGIAQVQVAKGYVSVLNGMGGAVNLVTSKPTRELEADGRGILNLGHGAEYSGYNLSGLIGTRHDEWYAQASFARNFTDHWDLSDGYTPTAIQGAGRRDLSRTADWRANVKAGFTPNATDEYSAPMSTPRRGPNSTWSRMSSPVSAYAICWTRIISWCPAIPGRVAASSPASAPLTEDAHCLFRRLTLPGGRATTCMARERTAA